MKYPIALGLSLICAGSLLAAQAQTPTPGAPAAPREPGQQTPAPSAPASPSTPSTQTSMKSDAAKMTYTGCLKPGATADSWVLENVEASAAAGAAGKSATAGTSGTAAKTFALTVKPGENLKAHANHKIEVSGTLGQGRSATGAEASAGAKPSEAGAAAKAPQQTFNVESFKMVSATCP